MSLVVLYAMLGQNSLLQSIQTTQFSVQIAMCRWIKDSQHHLSTSRVMVSTKQEAK